MLTYVIKDIIHINNIFNINNIYKNVKICMLVDFIIKKY